MNTAQIIDILQRYIFNIANLQGMLRLTTPIVLAGLCALISDRAGILNISGEGMMLFGAWFGVAGTFYLKSPYFGFLTAILSGLVLGGLFALFSLKFKANIIVMGIAINIFAVATTIYLTRAFFGTAGAFMINNGFLPIKIPLIQDIPVLGPIISGHTFPVYVSWILVAATAIFLYRTPWGIHLRAVGETPDAAETQGINVTKTRFLAIMASSVLASLAGVYLSLGHLHGFSDQMSSGRGFIGMAINTFAQGEPVGMFLTGLLIGFIDQIGFRLQAEKIIPIYFVYMLPYISTLLALVYITVRKREQIKKKSKLADS